MLKKATPSPTPMHKKFPQTDSCALKKWTLLWLCVCATSGSYANELKDRWTLIGRADNAVELMVDKASIQAVDERHRLAVELLNFRGEGGQLQSIMSGVIYDCDGYRKRDQFSAMYAGHWGTEEMLSSSPQEQRWFVIHPKSLAGSMYRFVCKYDLGT